MLARGVRSLCRARPLSCPTANVRWFSAATEAETHNTDYLTGGVNKFKLADPTLPPHDPDNEKVYVTLAAPHETLFKIESRGDDQGDRTLRFKRESFLDDEEKWVPIEVSEVVLPSTHGFFGVSAGMMPQIVQLAPGPIEIKHTGDKEERFFVSGGFAFIHAHSHIEISAAEVIPVEQLDPELIKVNYLKIVEALEIAKRNDDEVAIAEGEVGVQVHEAMAEALDFTL